ISAIKETTSGIEQLWTLAEKFLQRQRLVRRRKRFNERPAVAPGGERRHAVKQPIRRLHKDCSGSNVRLLSANHLQQNRAQQLTIHQWSVEILEDGQNKLQFWTETGLAKMQLGRRNFWQLRLLWL